MKETVTAIFLCLLAVTDSMALQVINLIEGKTEFVEVSGRDLNAIVFPVDADVYTGSDILDIKVQDRRIFVSFRKEVESGPPEESPEQIYILTDDGTYSMVLVPRNIPAETIIAKVKGLDEKEDVIKREKEHPYTSAMKTLIKAMYSGIPPGGYELVKANGDKDISKWEGISQRLDVRYAGVTLTGEKYVLNNNSTNTVRIKETEFYEEGVVAVSIDTHELRPNESSDVYVVRKMGVGNNP